MFRVDARRCQCQEIARRCVYRIGGHDVRDGSAAPGVPPSSIGSVHGSSVVLTVDDAADLLRTTRRAIYAMLERRQLPGVIRIRRRVLIRSAELLEWLDQKRAPSLKE